MLEWQIEGAFRGGLAGAVVFTFTDDWWRGGRQIEDWQMGLTTRDRQPKAAFRAVQKMFRAAPYFPLPRYPKVSVVVASYNGERTLKACLDSLERLNYPDYEVILVDDGSTDATRQIAFAHPNVRYFRHEKNLGLSVARNTGIAAATGEIVAFTDADCRADEDWLYYLVGGLLRERVCGHGRPQPPAAGRLAGGGGGDGFAGRAGARDADRPPGGAHPGLQHGVLQMGAGSRSAGSTRSSTRRATTWTCAGACSRRATRSVSARRRLSGIIGARPSAPI